MLKLKQPPNHICHSADEVLVQAGQIGYPVVVRPSYVLGGRAMAIVHDSETLRHYVHEIRSVFGDGPILIDGYLQNATELDVDALSDGEDVYIAGIMEHIEEAGIHSGDSACSLPPYSLSAGLIAEVRKQTIALAKALKVKGLMNVQFAIKGEDIYILEVNPRASRTVPFVAKATGLAVAKIATLLMVDQKLKNMKLPADDRTLPHVAVKEAVFPFARFPGVDVILGPEMKSTGESMGLDHDFPMAFAKAQLAAGTKLPTSGKVFVSVKDSDKSLAVEISRELVEIGFEIVATRGTALLLEQHGVPATSVFKVREGRPHIVDKMKDGKIVLVINTTEGAAAISDSFSIRRTALQNKITYTTTIQGASALVKAMKRLKDSPDGVSVKPLQDYFKVA